MSIITLGQWSYSSNKRYTTPINCAFYLNFYITEMSCYNFYISETNNYLQKKLDLHNFIPLIMSNIKLLNTGITTMLKCTLPILLGQPTYRLSKQVTLESQESSLDIHISFLGIFVKEENVKSIFEFQRSPPFSYLLKSFSVSSSSSP